MIGEGRKAGTTDGGKATVKSRHRSLSTAANTVRLSAVGENYIGVERAAIYRSYRYVDYLDEPYRHSNPDSNNVTKTDILHQHQKPDLLQIIKAETLYL